MNFLQYVVDMLSKQELLILSNWISGEDKTLTGVPIAQGVGIIPTVALKLTAVHIAAIFFLSGLLIATTLLGAQYMFRYRKYHIAREEDLDSLADPLGKLLRM